MNSKGLKAAAILLAIAALVAVFGSSHAPPTPAAAPALLESRPLPPNLVPDAPIAPAVVIPETGERPPTGYFPNPDATEKFLDTLERPTIREAGPELFEKQNIKQRSKATKVDGKGPVLGDDKGVYLWRALVLAYRQVYGNDWKVGTQKIGDCVSWGYMHGAATASAVPFLEGKSTTWKMPATEAIYGGSRVEARGYPGDGARAYGGFSDGSYGAAAAKWIQTRGGILFREKYDFCDLSVYSGDRAKQWGAYGCGGPGDGEKADKAAALHLCPRVALVKTFDEAAAAIRSGYPVAVCSGQGFTSLRDKDGFAAPSGAWGHCMCFVGVRFDRPGLLCLNSWGPTWIDGPKFPADQPEGSFWVDAAICTRMLSSQWGADSFAISAVAGFPFKPLDNGDWVNLPRAKETELVGPLSYNLAP